MTNNKTAFIQVIMCEPGKRACITTIENALASLQKLVGGYIEAVYPFEGKLNGLELNRALRDESGKVYDIIAGPFLVVGLGEEDFTSLSKNYQEKYFKLFEHPELFLRVDNDTQVIPIQTH